MSFIVTIVLIGDFSKILHLVFISMVKIMEFVAFVRSVMNEHENDGGVAIFSLQTM